MCGHDTAYVLDERAPDSPATEDAALARRAREEGRTLVTRDVQLAGRAEKSVLLESHEVRGQLRELQAAGISLEPDGAPRHCGTCNGPLARVEAGGTTPEYAPSRTRSPSGGVVTADSASGRGATGTGCGRR